MKILAVAGFKGGVGKSTLANFLAEKMGNATVLNLDNYQDAEDFNTTMTINLSKNDNLKDSIKNQSSDFFIIDAGGFDDERLSEVKLDLLILPSRTDYRSIKTTVDSAVTILNRIEDTTPILFVLNEYEKDKELELAVEMVQTTISLSSEIPTDNLHLFAIKKSNAIKTSINKKMSLKELAESNRVAYISINKQFDDFKDEVLEILGEV